MSRLLCPSGITELYCRLYFLPVVYVLFYFLKHIGIAARPEYQVPLVLCYNINVITMNQSGLLISLSGRVLVALMLIAVLALATWWGMQP